MIADEGEFPTYEAIMSLRGSGIKSPHIHAACGNVGMYVLAIRRPTYKARYPDLFAQCTYIHTYLQIAKGFH